MHLYFKFMNFAGKFSKLVHLHISLNEICKDLIMDLIIEIDLVLERKFKTLIRGNLDLKTNESNN